MNTYFLMLPSLGSTAIVEAPSTDKARTAFLDYLERNGSIPRNQRRLNRKNMATKLLADGADVPADIHIPYDYTWDQPPLAPDEAIDYIATDSQSFTASNPLPPSVPEPVEAPQLPPQQTMSPLARAALGI